MSFKFFLCCFIFVTSQSENIEEWNSRIDKKIDAARKKDAKIVLDAKIYGHNVKLQVNQTRTAFPLGTAVRASMIASCLEQGVDDGYCSFAKDNFNYIVMENALKWRQWEPEFSDFQTDNPDKTISWAKQNGMGVRGHCLFWAKNVSEHFPSWVYQLRGDDMKEAINHRIESAVNYYDVRTY